MKAYRAVRAGSGLMGAFVLAAGLGLTGCSDVDTALFGSGDDTAQQSAEPGTLDNSSSAPQAQNAAPRSQAAAPTSRVTAAAPADNGSVEAGTLPAEQPAQVAQTPVGGAMGAAITPVQIEQGSNTGTAVSSTIANLRSQVMSARRSHRRPMQQRLAGLRSQAGEQRHAPITRPRRTSPRACRWAPRAAIPNWSPNGTRRRLRSTSSPPTSMR